MKRLFTGFPILLLLLCITGMAASAQLLPVQPDTTQLRESARDTKNFYDIQREFYNYWKDKDSTQKGMGWKQFKRWEWFWEQRLNPDGTLPNPAILYEEWQKEQKRIEQKQKEEQRRNGKRSSEKLLAGNWSLLGPDRVPPSAIRGNGVGRINCLRIIPTTATTMWIGSASGGVWKTADGGVSWTNKSGNLPILGVSDIAIATTGTVYIATGDADGSMSYHPGYSIGVMKSVDDGGTWTATSLVQSTSNSFSIYRLLLHPSSSNTLLAGGTGGIRMITNGGAAHQHVFVTSSTSRITDMEFHPGNSDIVYAGGYEETTAIASVYRSANGGVTWSRVLVAPAGKRVALAVTPASSGTVYALIVNPDKGFRSLNLSVDGGLTWTTQATINVGGVVNILGTSATSTTTAGQGLYDLALAVSPVTASYVYVGGINVWMSNNSGVNWYMRSSWNAQGAPYMHADHHDLVFHPGSGTTLYSANDGGLWKSVDGTTSWSNNNLNNGLSIMQFYKLGCSATNANLVVGGAQDNGTNLRTGTTTGSWQHIYDGDGMECIIDYNNSANIFASLQMGGLRRSTNRGASFSVIQPANTTGAWVTPYVMHPTNPQVLFAGYDKIYRSNNAGTTWATISTADNLATDEKEYMTICPGDPNVVFAISGFLVYVSTNAMATASHVTWNSINFGNPPNMSSALPFLKRPISVGVHPQDYRKVWVTFGGYTQGEKVFYTSVLNGSWSNYSDGLPNLPVNCIVYQNHSPDVLYVGTDLGVYYRHRNMKQWEPYKDGLPNVIVTELEIHEGSRKLRASTYGRGMWESPLYEPPNIMLFQPNGGERWVAGNTYPIEWFTHSTIANIRIDYSLDNGTTWSTIASSTPAAAGRYTWAIPNISSTDVRVRIAHATIATIDDISDEKFTIERALRVVTPNGGNEIPVTSGTVVEWTVHTMATVTSITVQYRLSTTAAWTTIAVVTHAIYTTATSSLPWVTPATATTQASIRVVYTTAANIFDDSDSTFTLFSPLKVVAPNGGEKIPIASTTAIRWAVHTQATVTSLTIQCRLSTTAAWTTIATVPAAGTSGTYTWRTPVQTSTQASIRIFYLTTTAVMVSDHSDMPFSLVHPLRVVAPNGGERIAVTSATGIRWELHAQAVVTSLTFQYRTGPAGNWITIATAAVPPGATTGTQPWTTPTTATAQAQVRILYVTTGTWITSASTTAATTTATVEDTSDNNFSIVKLVALLIPNGGQNYPAGAATNIVWELDTNANVGVTQIKIEYSINAGATWATLTMATPAAPLSYPWTVPSVSTTQALVRITCTTNAAWTDTSDNTFAISTTATCGNMAAELDGGDDYLDAPNQTAPSALTLETWVIPRGVNGPDSADRYILFRRNSRTGAGNEAVALLYDEGNNLYKAVATSAGGTRTVVSSPVGSAGAYSPAHVALTLNGSELALYLNGRLQGRKSTGYSIDYADSTLWFGCTGDSTNDGFFNGAIDEVRFWSTVRSETDIYNTMYQRHLPVQTGLAGYWHFDNATPAAAPDASGNGNAAVLHNGAQVVDWPDSVSRFTWHIEGPGLIVAPHSTGTYTVPAVAGTGYLWSVQNGAITGGQGTNQITVQWNADSAGTGSVALWSVPVLSCGTYAECTVEFVGCRNYALSFDGWDDEAELLNSALVQGQNFTLEAWINPSSVADSTLRCILGSRQLHAAERPPVLATRGNAVVVGFGDGTAWHETSADSALAPGMWQHIAAAFDGSTLKIFVDGEEKHSTSAFSGLTPFPAPVGYIGSGEGTFYGMIDEVRIWNSARSAVDIREAMYCRFATVQTGMTGYWKFDEDYSWWWGSAAYDIAGYNDGAVAGAWRTWATLPAPPVAGPDTVVANTGGHVYCVPSSACDTYVWSISGGAITSGQNTECVTVEWGGGPSGMLSVSTQGEYSCGSYATAYVAVLPPPIVVVHPDSGDTVVAGMMSPIYWSQSYAATTSTVSIELSVNSGSTWSFITTATPSYYGSNYYAWVPPAVATTTALVRIADVGNPSAGDTGGLFKIILPALLPPGNLTATAGDSEVILSWSPSSSPGITGYNIYSRPESSGSFSLLATVSAGTTFFSDGSVVNGTRYFYALTALDGTGESAFSAVVSAVPAGGTLSLNTPNGGEVFTTGTQVLIAWTPSSPQDSVMLEYSCNNGLAWYPVALLYGGTSYVWTVPSTPTVYGRLRVRNLSGTLSDVSDGTFTIRSGYETAVNVRLFLEGAYSGGGSMSNSLQTMGFLPFGQPYAASPFNYFGPETRGMCVIDPVVDWVLVDIRNAMNPAVSMARTAALVRSDGVLLDESGYPEVLLAIPPGMYYIAISHRNHLEVMSSVPVYLSTGSSSPYTFTTGQGQAYQVFMPTLKQVDVSVFGLSAGDVQHDDVINADDRVRVINALGRAGYMQEDVTLDGVVTALDRVLTENNQFLVSQVP